MPLREKFDISEVNKLKKSDITETPAPDKTSSVSSETNKVVVSIMMKPRDL